MFLQLFYSFFFQFLREISRKKNIHREIWSTVIGCISLGSAAGYSSRKVSSFLNAQKFNFLTMKFENIFNKKKTYFLQRNLDIFYMKFVKNAYFFYNNFFNNKILKKFYNGIFYQQKHIFSDNNCFNNEILKFFTK